MTLFVPEDRGCAELDLWRLLDAMNARATTRLRNLHDAGYLRELHEAGGLRDSLAGGASVGGDDVDLRGGLAALLPGHAVSFLAALEGELLALDFKLLTLEGELLLFNAGGALCGGAFLGLGLHLPGLLLLCGGAFHLELHGGLLLRCGDLEEDTGGGVEIRDFEPAAAVVVPVGGDPDLGAVGVEPVEGAFVGPAIHEPLVRLGGRGQQQEQKERLHAASVRGKWRGASREWDQAGKRMLDGGVKVCGIFSFTSGVLYSDIKTTAWYFVIY